MYPIYVFAQMSGILLICTRLIFHAKFFFQHEENHIESTRTLYINSFMVTKSAKKFKQKFKCQSCSK